MHIHPPKPLHGWKEFLNEIFVIVIGVLIALGFEQVVEELHWQHKVHEGEERLKVESRDNYSSMVERITVSPCIAAQIDQLADQIRNGGDHFAGAASVRTINMPEVARVIRQPSRNINIQTWSALLQDGTATHFSVSRQAEFGQLYTVLSKLSVAFDDLDKIRSELDVLGGKLDLSPEVKLSLLEKLSLMKSTNGLVGLNSKQVVATMNKLGLQPSLAAIEEGIRASKLRGSMGFCIERHLPLADWRQAVEQLSENPSKPI